MSRCVVRGSPMNKTCEAFDENQPLDPELMGYIIQDSGRKYIQHPLVTSGPHNAELNAQVNFDLNAFNVVEMPGVAVGSITLHAAETTVALNTTRMHNHLMTHSLTPIRAFSPQQ